MAHDTQRQDAYIDVFPTSEIGTVSPLLFSGFLEHLGRCPLYAVCTFPDQIYVQASVSMVSTGL
jgi:hypothetical protein